MSNLALRYFIIFGYLKKRLCGYNVCPDYIVMNSNTLKRIIDDANASTIEAVKNFVLSAFEAE